MKKKYWFDSGKVQRGLVITSMIMGLVLISTGCGLGAKSEKVKASNSPGTAVSASQTSSVSPAISPTAASALYADQEGKCGKNAKWKYDGESYILTVYGKGVVTEQIALSNNDSVPIKEVIVKEGITEIRAEGFVEYRWLDSSELDPITKIKLPNSLKSVSSGALRYMAYKKITLGEKISGIDGTNFWDAKYLEEIEVSSKNKKLLSSKGILFSKDKKSLLCYPCCKKSKSYKIPNKVTKISDLAFAQNEQIEVVKIPKKLTSLGAGAFGGCVNLKSVDLKRNTKISEISDYSDGYNIVYATTSLYDEIPDDFYKLGTFEGTAITSIVIPDKVRYIGYDTFNILYSESRGFKECIDNSLQKIYIGKSYIGNINAGEGYKNVFPLWKTPVKSITISPKNSKYCIKNKVLYTKDKKTICQVLANNTKKNMVIGKNVNNIAVGAFVWMKKLKKLTVAGSLNEIGDYAFYPEFQYQKYPEYHSSMKFERVVVNGDIKRIGKYAFNSTLIQKFTCKGSIGYIDYQAFGECTGLKQFICNKGIEHIGSRCFEQCINLKKITLDKRIKYIDESAFASCESLETVSIASTLRKMKNCAFGWCYALKKVTLPASAKVNKFSFNGCKRLKKKNIIRK